MELVLQVLWILSKEELGNIYDMPKVFKGSNATLAISSADNLPFMIDGWSIVNKAAGANVVNVYLIAGIYNICIAPLNNSLASGAIYESVRPVLMLAGEQIKVQSSGSVDYLFTLSNVNP